MCLSRDEIAEGGKDFSFSSIFVHVATERRLKGRVVGVDILGAVDWVSC
jgi:hypothetical protein